MTKNFCKQRVWDNGDMKDCGRKETAHELCGEHLREKKLELKAQLKKVCEEERRIGAELARLYLSGK